MSSQFDPNVFLDATTTEVNEKRDPLPTENPADTAGLYIATIGEVVPKSGTVQKEGDNYGKPWLQMAVPLKIDVPPQLREALGLPPVVTVTDRVFIDLTPDGKGIDNGKGKNRGQKAYRDATGLNKEGESFSWRMLQGRPVRVKISHDLYEGQIQERIAAVLPMA